MQKKAYKLIFQLNNTMIDMDFIINTINNQQKTISIPHLVSKKWINLSVIHNFARFNDLK